ncbi:FAD binding domain-containing protein [Rhodococcus sp. NPDC057529]|uniref:FAD binding domain-containing protein n=1 Tax=Rhodococcus sp. NPDC057529 TaxID=3346158 RepID=UPI00366D5EA4
MIDHPCPVHMPTTVVDALTMLLSEPSSALLAGGQSILVAMKAGDAHPGSLIDLSGVSELRGMEVVDDGDLREMRIGPMTRHFELETFAAARTEIPLLARAASAIADPQVRHIGTIGGSLMNADPAADLPAALIALRAQVAYLDSTGEHFVDVEKFLRTADENRGMRLITQITVPVHRDEPWGFQKFRTRAMMWAIVGVSYVGGSRPGIGLAGMGPRSCRAVRAEEALRAGASVKAVAALADKGTTPQSDLFATEEYRRNLARVLLARALAGDSTF